MKSIPGESFQLLEGDRLTSLFDRAKSLKDAASGRLVFNESFETSLSAGSLWYELQKAFGQSTTSDIWPNEFATLESDGLEPHAIVEVSYKVFFTGTPCQYKILDLDLKYRSVKYRALKQHIFEGGGEIAVRAKGKGSVLEWRGEYVFGRPASIQALVFRLYFQERFFARLRANLKSLNGN